MTSACDTFRQRWLDRLGASGADLADPRAEHPHCEVCARWARRAAQVRALLGELPVRSAPAELEEAVAHALAAPAGERVERALAALSIRRAPAALDERVAAALSATEGEHAGSLEADLGIQAVRALERLAAPSVLERLVEEELAEPTLARAERFAGDLERRRAPHLLERRFVGALRREAGRRSVLKPVVALIAAGLVVWVAVRGDGERAREYRFQVLRIEARATELLDPRALELLDALSGGLSFAPPAEGGRRVEPPEAGSAGDGEDDR